MTDGSEYDGGRSPLSGPDLAAVTAFLTAFAPGIEALTTVGRQLSEGGDDDRAPAEFTVEWS
jgi:hypothetical protein